EYYLLTPEQERMFELHRFYGLGNRIFNMPWVGELEVADEKKLEKAIMQLIERHESLRTSFRLVNGRPVQVVHKQADFKIEYFDLAAGNTGDTADTGNKIHHSSFITHHFIRAFDLSKAPLLRVGVLKQPGEKILLLIDMHHIVSDGTSFGILLRELKALFQGNTLPPLRVQYKDYVQWQGSEERKKILAKQEVYWLNLLSKQVPPLLLPFDFPRPAVRGMAADVIDFELDSKEVKALRELAKNENCSFFMVMLALFNVLLFKLTGREDIIVSTFFAGRRSPELRKMVGMFVNTLLLRNYPTGEKQFTVFLNEVKQHTLNAYENQDYSRERLMKKKGFTDKKSFQVDVNFVLQNMDPSERLMSGFQVLQSASTISGNENEPRVSFYDLRFEGFELEERLIFNVEYDINLFKEESIMRFITDFKNIVSSVVGDPGKKIAAI
ncbi:MAG TPA: condensation domain-containing protein, partial [Candidatus Kapabacteria bacterium]|nr:condensation domain-containing protein [Candidatus Kapabacteria bacterium]